jgi:hypothetical protein
LLWGALTGISGGTAVRRSVTALPTFHDAAFLAGRTIRASPAAMIGATATMAKLCETTNGAIAFGVSVHTAIGRHAAFSRLRACCPTFALLGSTLAGTSSHATIRSGVTAFSILRKTTLVSGAAHVPATFQSGAATVTNFIKTTIAIAVGVCVAAGRTSRAGGPDFHTGWFGPAGTVTLAKAAATGVILCGGRTAALPVLQTTLVVGAIHRGGVATGIAGGVAVAPWCVLTALSRADAPLTH